MDDRVTASCCSLFLSVGSCKGHRPGHPGWNLPFDTSRLARSARDRGVRRCRVVRLRQQPVDDHAGGSRPSDEASARVVADDDWAKRSPNLVRPNVYLGPLRGRLKCPCPAFERRMTKQHTGLPSCEMETRLQRSRPAMVWPGSLL